MRLVPLEIGRLDTDLAPGTGEARRAMLPIACWLIEHSRGLVLFDTGMHIELQTDSARIGAIADIFEPDFHAGEEVSARLAARGIAAADIDRMVLSHLHFDHAGGMEEVPNARFVVQRSEWQAAQDTRLREAKVYDPADFEHGHDLELVEGEHDVFGDGRVVCLPTPGHTAGHQSLRVELEAGPVVLTADCVYFEALLDAMETPRFGHDLERQKVSMRELRRLREEEGCRLLFGHDLAQFRSLPSDGLC